MIFSKDNIILSPGKRTDMTKNKKKKKGKKEKQRKAEKKRLQNQ